MVEKLIHHSQQTEKITLHTLHIPTRKYLHKTCLLYWHYRVNRDKKYYMKIDFNLFYCGYRINRDKKYYMKIDFKTLSIENNTYSH